MSREQLDKALTDLITEPEAKSVICVVTSIDGQTGVHMKAGIPDMLYAIHLLRDQIRRIEAQSADT